MSATDESGRHGLSAVPGSAVEPDAPVYMSAFDGGDWSYYVRGHDPAELVVIDDPAELTYENLWMQPTKASTAEDYGVWDEDPDDTVLRDLATGKFTARIIWIECAESVRCAVPFMGVRYRAGRGVGDNTE